jgi:relA/spoT domain protein
MKQNNPNLNNIKNTPTPPWKSRTRLNKAGDAARKDQMTEDDKIIIERWRESHKAVLNTFQALLRKRVEKLGMTITIATRHKRKNTIFDKLNRIKDMELSRMDDIAGCRLIFKSIQDLEKFREDMHSKSRFKHALVNEKDKYDYIKKPKSTGYRGIHDIYKYEANSEQGRKIKGLYVEIQYRTLVQHAWATTVEVIGQVTQNQPKFERGDPRHREAMSLASEILARAHENKTGPHSNKTNKEILDEFKKVDEEINIMKILKSLKASQIKDILEKSIRKEVFYKKNMLLILSEEMELKIEQKLNSDPLKRLFELERNMPNKDIVLVGSTAYNDVETAFRNYFLDTTDFLSLMESAIKILKNKNESERLTHEK